MLLATVSRSLPYWNNLPLLYDDITNDHVMHAINVVYDIVLLQHEVGRLPGDAEHARLGLAKKAALHGNYKKKRSIHSQHVNLAYLSLDLTVFPGGLRSHCLREFSADLLPVSQGVAHYLHVGLVQENNNLTQLALELATVSYLAA